LTCINPRRLAQFSDRSATRSAAGNLVTTDVILGCREVDPISTGIGNKLLPMTDFGEPPDASDDESGDNNHDDDHSEGGVLNLVDGDDGAGTSDRRAEKTDQVGHASTPSGSGEEKNARTAREKRLYDEE